MMDNNTPNRMWLRSPRRAWILFSLTLLVAMAAVILQSGPDRHNPLRTLGEYLLLSFPVSLGILAVIGVRSYAKDEIRRCLTRAFVFSLCLLGIFGILVPLISGMRYLRDLFFLCLVPFAILCPNTGMGALLIFVLWALYVGMLTVSLCHARRLQDKVHRAIAHLAIVMVFGIAYAAGWYFTSRAIGMAIALGVMVGSQ